VEQLVDYSVCDRDGLCNWFILLSYLPLCE